MGPKLAPEDLPKTAEAMDILTDYVNSTEITRQRVRRGHEEESLLSLFPNGFVVHQGNHRNVQEKIAEMKSNGAMLRVQAPNGAAAKAVEQMDVKCANLNSGDSFIVTAPGGNFLWNGLGSNEQEQVVSAKIYESFGGGANIKEEEESEEFWAALGGRTEYSNEKDTGIAAGFEPRLFHCSNSSGSFYI